jgi:acetyltransferase-like isoleucine patch superfamily enzyme
MLEPIWNKLLRTLSHDQVKGIKRLYRKIVHLYELRKDVVGSGNRIIHHDTRFKQVSITVRGDDNLVEIYDSFLEHVTIMLRGSRHRLFIGPRSWLTGSRIFFEDHDCRISLSGENICVSTKLSVAENGTKIVFGSGSMVGEGSDIRSSDGHSLVDLATGKRLNPAMDVIIGDHVFMGEGVAILKGVSIGDDCFVAARSVVTKSFPANCLIGGIPARILRQNVTWKWERI